MRCKIYYVITLCETNTISGFRAGFSFCFVSAQRKNQFAGKLTLNFIRSSEHCKQMRLRARQRRSFALISNLVDFWWHPGRSRSQTQWHPQLWILSRWEKFVQFTDSNIINQTNSLGFTRLTCFCHFSTSRWECLLSSFDIKATLVTIFFQHQSCTQSLSSF